MSDLMTHPDIMLDIETFGTGNNAAIVSIGAVAFDQHLAGGALFHDTPEQHEIYGVGFHRRIDLAESRRELIGDIDPGTVEWWLGQSDDARASLLEGKRVALGKALRDFSYWLIENFAEPKQLRLWSNGPTFDETIVRAAFDRYGFPFPISYRGSRCCRTLFALATEYGFDPKPTPEHMGDIIKHNALHDAVFQARGVVLQNEAISVATVRRRLELTGG